MRPRIRELSSMRLPFALGAPEADKSRNVIDGQFVESAGGRYLENLKRATGKP
jgi:hypothetical protein